MSTYLTLTNELLRRMGEVVMDINDFASARNVQALAKTSVNSSVREMMHSVQEWPFLLTTNTQTLSAGVTTYDFPDDLASADWESFYLKKHSSEENHPSRLPIISYTEYLNKYRAIDDINGSAGYAAPAVVFQTQESKFGVSPPPSTDFQIEYKYFKFPVDMVDPTDDCIVPSRFDTVVIDGAMFYMLMYRSNEQGANIYRERFDNGIKTMRRLLLDDPTMMKSTMLIHPKKAAQSFSSFL